MQISQRQVLRSARRDWQSAGTDTYPLSAGNGCLSLNTNSDWIPSWWWQAPRVWPRDLPTGINGRTVINFRSTTSQLPPPLDVGVATWMYDKRLAIDFYLALYFPDESKHCGMRVTHCERQTRPTHTNSKNITGHRRSMINHRLIIPRFGYDT